MFDRDTLLTFKRLLDKCPDRIMDALDSLSANQFESKDWLVEKLNQYPEKRNSNRFQNMRLIFTLKSE